MISGRLVCQLVSTPKARPLLRAELGLWLDLVIVIQDRPGSLSRLERQINSG